MHLEYFDKYVGIGLRPIAVYRHTKLPVEADWNQGWAAARWRDYFRDAHYNMGILLGDVIDVEADTDEADRTLTRMIGGVPHPAYRSHKSTHHFFQSPDPRLTRLVAHGIEFRGHLHQSLVPPSVHANGVEYRFLRESRFPAPPMPPRLLDFFFRNRKKKKCGRSSLRLGHIRTACNVCRGEFAMHKKRLGLEVKAFAGFGMTWACRKCREMDVRQACRELRQTFQDPYKSSWGTAAAASTARTRSAGR